MKIAIVGLRHMHITTLIRWAQENPETEIAGFWEEDPEIARRVREHFSEPFYDSYEALLADGSVDIVAVGDYFGVRGQRILRALRAGKHVITDKPVCTSLEELDEIEKVLSETGLKLGCMLDLRHDPVLRRAQELIRGGGLGEIRSLSVTGQHPLSWGSRPKWYFEDGKHGGTFNDLAVHGLDAIGWITGLDYGKTLCARTWNSFAVHAPQFPDSAQLMAEMENGAGLIADVSYSAPSPLAFSLPPYWRFTFWGEKGWLEVRHGQSSLSMALEGDSEIRTVAAGSPDGDNLIDLLREIRGEATEFDTESVLRAARISLTVQRDADRK